MHTSLRQIVPHFRGAIFGLVIGCLAAALLVITSPYIPALAVTQTIIQTTVSDFNSGFFYHTGLTKDTNGGGDGDGEVRLMTWGINASTWQKGTGNTTGLPALQAHAATLTNGRIYVSGGQTTGGFTPVSGVYYTTISTTTHNLSNWSATTSLPQGRYAHGMVALNGYVYVIGGFDSTFHPTTTVYYAQIQSNGSLGTWSSASGSGLLPVALNDFATVVVNGRIYVIGGADNSGNAQNTVYYAQPGSNGAITAWSTATAHLTNAIYALTGAASNGVIYVIGGQGATYYPNVYYGAPGGSGDISAWTTTNPLQNNLVFASAAAFGGQLYVVGGANNNGLGTTGDYINSDLINPNGSLDQTLGWSSSQVLSAKRQQAASVLSSDGWVYVIEGNGSTILSPLNTIDFGPTSTAGATAYAPSGNYTSASLDLGGSYPVTQIKWTTYITTSTSMTLTYRIGATADLSAVAWSAGQSAALGAATNTLTLPPNSTGRYIQYRVQLAGNAQNTRTPVLNKVVIYYDVPPTPTPTRTSTKSGTPGTPTATNTPTRTPTNTPAVTATSTPTVTPGATSVTAEESSWLVQYQGWRGVSNALAQGGYYRISKTAGNIAKWSFSGSAVKWITQKGPDQGKAQVTIDGKNKGTFDLYSPTTQWQVQIAFSRLGSGSHNIVIKVLGTKNASATDVNVVLDAFKIGTTFTQEGARTIQYGSWKGALSTSAYGGAYRYTNVKGQAVSFKFTGTKVNWVTEKCPGCGKANVFIDGLQVGPTVDLYSSSAKWKVVIPFSGLAPGTHTIQINVLGTKNSRANGFKVLVDRFQSFP